MYLHMGQDFIVREQEIIDQILYGGDDYSDR